MFYVLVGIAYYLSILVFPAITILIKELRKDDTNDFIVVVCNIFLSLWLFCFVQTVFSMS